MTSNLTGKAIRAHWPTADLRSPSCRFESLVDRRSLILWIGIASIRALTLQQGCPVRGSALEGCERSSSTMISLTNGRFRPYGIVTGVSGDRHHWIQASLLGGFGRTPAGKKQRDAAIELRRRGSATNESTTRTRSDGRTSSPHVLPGSRPTVPDRKTG